MESFINSLSKLQIFAVISFILLKLFTLSAIVFTITSVFIPNTRIISLIMIICSVVFLVSCVLLCCIDLIMKGKEVERRADAILADPEMRKVLLKKLTS